MLFAMPNVHGFLQVSLDFLFEFSKSVVLVFYPSKRCFGLFLSYFVVNVRKRRRSFRANAAVIPDFKRL